MFNVSLHWCKQWWYVNVIEYLLEDSLTDKNLCLYFISSFSDWHWLLTTFGWLNTELVLTFFHLHWRTGRATGRLFSVSARCAVGLAVLLLLCSLFWFRLSSDKKAVYVLLRNLIWVPAYNLISYKPGHFYHQHPGGWHRDKIEVTWN